jgi:ABC-type glycerol-3-phosphate transport system substrate-binding protein
MFTRRTFLTSCGIAALAAPLLAACGAATAGPAATAAAAAAAAQNAVKAGATAVAPPGAATTSAMVAPAAAPGGAKTALSITVWTIAGRTWQKIYAQKYQQAHPEIALRIDTVVYADMAQKQLTGAASNTLQDVVYSGINWMQFSAYKGAFRPLDDLVSQQDPNMADYFPDAIAGSKINGKLFGLPFQLNPGNTNVVMYNQDILNKQSVTPPTDTWTLDEFAQMAQKLTNADAHVFGTDLFYGNYYDFGTLARSLGGDVISADGKAFTLTTDPKTLQAAQWMAELRTKYKAAPSRAESQGVAFPAGQIALHCDGIQNVIPVSQSIGSKFPWGVVLGPTGPGGLRGRDGFVTTWNMSAHTKSPEAAYALMRDMSSPSTLQWALINQGGPSPRPSNWQSAEVGKMNAIFPRAGLWMTDKKDQGPFPMPYNLRFSELQDKYANISPATWYGEVAFQDGVNTIQTACQQIVAEARP